MGSNLEDATLSDAAEPVGLDTTQYTLFVNSVFAGGDFVSEVIRRVALNHLQGQIEIRQQSDNEMKALAPDVESEGPAVILEEVIAGPTSVILDFVSPADILAELDSLSAPPKRSL